MIAEPYICIKGEKAGEIEWKNAFCIGLGVPIGDELGNRWIPYADFEREKLSEIHGATSLTISHGYTMWSGYCVKCEQHESVGKTRTYYSGALIGYKFYDHERDTESNRLLKRAEFLREVCKRENVEWLPNKGESLVEAAPPCKQASTNQTTCECEDCTVNNCTQCPCDCHKKQTDTNTSVCWFDGRGKKTECDECGKKGWHECKAKQTDVVEEMCENNSVYVGDMKPGEERDIFCEGKKVCTITMNENCASCDVMPDKKQESNFYTKQEIDERFDAIVSLLDPSAPERGSNKSFKRLIDHFRSRFLS